MSALYVDADVLIPYLRGHKAAKAWLKNALRTDRAALTLGAMQRAEILFFAFPEKLDTTLGLLNVFRTDAVDEAVIDAANEIYRSYHRSHGTGINDAILAAQVVRSGGRLATRNTKHFPLPELKLVLTW